MLGAGGFGVVFLVSERQTSELRALKTFREEFLADAAAREAFKKEALLWVNLGEHSFVLSARWVEEFSGRLFVMMDYVAPDAEGRVSLADYFLSRTPIAAQRAVEWAIQFCSGMEHATTHGIRCHRDIKPSNILIGKEGNIKIADFGLATVQHKLTDRERLAAELCEQAGIELIVERSKEKERLLVSRDNDGSFGFSIVETQGKLLSGTPGYIAPEVFRGAAPDLRSDVYAFGLVLWQMATGSIMPPFVEAGDNDVVRFMQKTYENQIAGKFPVVTHPLGTVIRKCLTPLPTDRYPTFGEMRRDLEVIFQNLTGRQITKAHDSSQTVSFWCNKGLSLVTLGQHKEAISCFDKALSIDPADAMSWCNKGATLVNLGQYESAISCLDKAIAIDPAHALAWSNKAGALVELGQSKDALACYDKALILEPRSTAAWNNKGRIFDSLGLHEEAIVCFNKVLNLDPKHSAALNNKARTLVQLDRHNESLACYDKAIAVEPTDALLWNNKGACFAAMGQPDDEIACYEKALEIDPRHAMAWFNKAGTEDMIGRTAAAIQLFQIRSIRTATICRARGLCPPQTQRITITVTRHRGTNAGWFRLSVRF